VSLALLIPGGSGQLGRELVARAPSDAVVAAPGSTELNLTQPRDVLAAVDALVSVARAAGLPPVVINPAAYTKVDDAETDSTRAFAVNADGPRLLAAACSSRGVPLVHVSTDYVFAGDASAPYEVDSPIAPRSVYGVTKAAGENAVLLSPGSTWVVRTSWVYGAHGHNFVRTMVRLALGADPVSVVDDQWGAPTWAADLADGLLSLASLAASGAGPAQRLLHCTAAGETTWFEFARAVFEEVGADPSRVGPCKTVDHPRPAARPAYSVLSPASWLAAGLPPRRHWREALKAAFATDSFR